MFQAYRNLPRTVHILCFGTFINRAGSFVLIYLTLYISKELDFEATFATQCMGLFGLGSILAALVGGQLADRFGRRIVMLLSHFVGAALLVTLSFLESKFAIALTTLFYALFVEMYRPAASAMIGDVVSPRDRPHAFGLMYIAINLGFTCGAFLGSVIVTVSFKGLFYGDALTTALCGLVIYLAITETRPTTDGAMKEKRTRADLAVWRIGRDWTFLLFCLATLMGGIVFVQGMTTLPLYLESLGHPPEIFGRLMIINGAMIAILQLPLTSLFNRIRWNGIGVIALGSGVIGIGFWLTGSMNHLGLFAGTVVIWTLGEMMTAPFQSSVVSELAPVDLRARYMGLFTMCFSLALLVGAPLGGFILHGPGPRYLWNGALALAVAAGLLYASLRWSVRARTGSSPPSECESIEESV